VALTEPAARDYERFRLPNGLDVVLQRIATVPVVTVMTTYKVGSANERPGRTGFSHLFEHLMFRGSRNVASGRLAALLVEAGGGANATTSRDRTVFASWASAENLERVLYLEAERMAFLRDGLSPERIDVERSVVLNERRDRMDNVRYGNASTLVAAAMYGTMHPYRWPTLGTAADIGAATLDELREFHQTYYIPNNAALVIVGDIDVSAARAMVVKWFGTIARGAEPPSIIAPVARIDREVRMQEEQGVPLPRLYVSWTVPQRFAPAGAALDVLAELLGRRAGGRLRERLVNELQLAQDVNISHESSALSGEFQIVVTARPGIDLDSVDAVIRAEIATIQSTAPDSLMVRRIIGGRELRAILAAESTGGRADRLSDYLSFTGEADFFDQDMARYRAVVPQNLSDVAMSFLPLDRRVLLSIVPKGKPELGVGNSRPSGGAR
jgi:zinc protease